MTRLRIALAQINPKVGDLDGNVAKICAAYDEAEAAGCDIVAFPELAITGYPPEDLVMKPGFVADNLAALATVAARTGRCAAVVGYVAADRDLYNAAAVCANGEVVGTYRKRLLPNYAVFDEARYFTPGDVSDPYELYVIGGVKVGISICEDVWSPTGPLAEQAAGGAELNININGSPFHAGKAATRERMLATRAADASCALAYVNQVCGQDELVFDGGSLVFDAEGTLVARAATFVEELLITDIVIEPVYRKRLLDPRGRRTEEQMRLITISEQSVNAYGPLPARISPLPDDDAELYEALVLGTRDYVRKNGFTDVVIGLSGGIDSTIVACVAVDALGAEHVHGVSMPSRYSSDHSKSDAADLALQLGIDYRTVAIEPAFNAYLEMTAEAFADKAPDLTEENLQSRIRGTTLMALSNKFGWMVLTTGNKSEMAVGYFTIYGDSVGGYAVIKDVLKTRVYDLCRYVNRRAGRQIINESVITKPPSAELRPDQRDDQSLPPYEVLDPILRLYVEEDRTYAEIVEMGHDEVIVRRITRLVDINEYKRRQCPPGVRVSVKAFGKDRRLPITNGYRG
ncbi:MAG: NAD+ synthase [Actinobacteria bacterium]|uniref:NAD(+) synthase (glutamine-hydrolyzing) n=1 Tax=freshwater metagenome TaxID=449393 RepID=A0A6J6A9B5_9ZZZZ|nr:NAD+ synthase [Actinomycetota bacterium]MSW76937.1 NAD+ synthase [Actinomycetota bacterium]MSX93473.1 NAD+ synthase [Actinomycetota bacterium]MSZ82843.1 NAD+ synthase [Actinomycetota bacterium]MTB17206.1 NAD+ synthase [Actinomycetota bacterium]